MACFTVSAAEAVIVTMAKKAEVKKEARELTEGRTETKSAKIPLSVKLTWLRNMLLGGSVLLLFEHVWHGEIVPWFPFLTAMSNSADMMEMLKEMATVGVSMALLITFTWGIMCVCAEAILKREVKKPAQNSEN